VNGYNHDRRRRDGSHPTAVSLGGHARIAQDADGEYIPGITTKCN